MTTSHQDGLPTPDLLRQITRDARNQSFSASDDSCPEQYVLAGWKARAAYGLANACDEEKHAEAYYRQAEKLLTSNEVMLHAEGERLRKRLQDYAKAATLIRAMGEKATTYQVQSALEAAAKMLEELE
jgi:hypothetical protein